MKTELRSMILQLRVKYADIGIYLNQSGLERSEYFKYREAQRHIWTCIQELELLFKYRKQEDR